MSRSTDNQLGRVVSSWRLQFAAGVLREESKERTLTGNQDRDYENRRKFKCFLGIESLALTKEL